MSSKRTTADVEIVPARSPGWLYRNAHRFPVGERTLGGMETTEPLRDQDSHKGAIEEERPGPERADTPGLDENGLPNDATAIAQDALGARDDSSQG